MDKKKKMGIILMGLGPIIGGLITWYGIYLNDLANSETAKENTEKQIESDKKNKEDILDAAEINTQKTIESDEKNKDEILDVLTPYSEKVNILWDIYQKDDKTNRLSFEIQVQAQKGLSKNELEEFLIEVTVKSKNLVEVAKAYMMQGKYENASVNLRKSLEFTPRKEDKAWIYFYLGSCYLQILGENKQAKKYLENSFKFFKRFSEKGSMEEKNKLGIVSNELGMFYKRIGRYKDAADKYDIAISVRKDLVEKEPSTYLIDLGGSFNNKAVMLVEMKERGLEIKKGSIEYNYNKAIKAKKKSLEYDFNNILNYATTLNNLANWYMKNGRYDLSYTYYQNTLEIYDEAREQDPQTYNPLYANAKGNFANAIFTEYYYTKKGDLKKSREMFEESLDILRQADYTRNPLYLKFYLGALGNYRWMADYEKDHEKFKRLDEELQGLMNLLNNLNK